MRAVDLIVKKRDGHALSKEEIDFLIQGYMTGQVPDYQMAAWAMAVYFQGMTPEETTHLTLAMAYSGQVLDLRHVLPKAVDKHSTGGVGDKTSLVVVPLVAAAGLPVAKMSGRGLGFTGGTLDKLESIPGFRTDLSIEEFVEQVRRVGCVISGQTADLAPADGKLYALRDVTGTVPSIPLIASSIMSKKIAAGAHNIVLDVKVGLGAFMPTLEKARELAQLMVDIARHAGRRAVALLADMNQPLGQAAGNALEVKEAIATLRGSGPEDFVEHCLEVAAYMLYLGDAVPSPEAGKALARDTLDSGRAWEKFRAMVQAQGGDIRAVDEPDRLPAAPFVHTVTAPRGGYLAQVHARRVGEVVMRLGAGRAKKGDPVDPAVGVVTHVKVGDRVEPGMPLFTLHTRREADLTWSEKDLLDALQWSDDPVEPLPHFYGVIT